MNRSILISAISAETGYNKTVTEEILAGFEKVVTRELQSGLEVTTALGKFSTSFREQRQGRNPKTGETLTIAASVSPKFKASKGLKDALN